MEGFTTFILAVLAVMSTELGYVLGVAIRSAPTCGNAAVTIDVTGESGVRTEKGHGSSIHFPELSRPIKTDDYVSIDFKTDKDAGLLLFLATQDLSDYIMVFIQNGKPRLQMKCGHFEIDINSHLPSLRDGDFHKLILKRHNNKEFLSIDSHRAFRSYHNTCPQLSKVFIGGFPSSFQTDTRFSHIRRFQGCFKNFNLNSNPVDEFAKYTSVSTC